MQSARNLLKRYDTLEKNILIAMIAVMIIVIFAQVITRYIFGAALYWSEELGKFIFVWASWLGVSAGLKSNEHIQVKLLPDTLHAKGFFKTEKGIYILIDLFWFITSIVIVYYGSKIVIGQMETGVYGASTQIPMWILYLSVPFSSAVICLRLIGQVIINVSELICMFKKRTEDVK